MIRMGSDVYVADTAVIIGDVTIGDNVTIMDSAVIRGDENAIKIGDNSNIQDNATIHVNLQYGTFIGKNVSIGHNAIVHGATVDDNVLIGMGAIVLNNAHLKSGTVVAAGAVIPENFESEGNCMIAGIPGKVKRTGDQYHTMAYLNSLEYIKLNGEFRAGKYEIMKGKTHE
ncbi:MAG TPA: gamma carbonic anhydrase family protein [Ferroplasma sp.]|nr:gamma carbonic anhydrase family protein [Ferroplasma sp.]